MRIEDVEDLSAKAARNLALVGFLGLFALASMTTLDVTMRWLFHMPIAGVNDVSSVVMAVVIAACIPATFAMRQNIRVAMLGGLWGGYLGRILEVFASLFSLGFVILIAWQMIPYVQGLFETNERTWVLAWPIWPWWAFAAFMSGLAVLCQLAILVVDIRRLFPGARLAAPASMHPTTKE